MGDLLREHELWGKISYRQGHLPSCRLKTANVEFYAPGFSLTLFQCFLTSTDMCEGKPYLS
jgi:hypothetical protein